MVQLTGLARADWGQGDKAEEKEKITTYFWTAAIDYLGRLDRIWKQRSMNQLLILSNLFFSYSK